MLESRASSPREFRERNNISNTTLYKEIKEGRLIALKVGRRTIITAEAERNWLASLPRLREVA
jgi:predicted site-specific integrase-resolvase